MVVKKRNTINIISQRALRPRRLMMLKKQSQFEGKRSDVSSYLKGIYDKTPPCGA
ncbi:MAG: hypothetical protein ACYS3S_20610 [Planctomycetota bacterium]